MDWREVNEAELAECLDIEPRMWGDEIVGRERALAGWKEMLRSRSFNSAVIETDGLDGGRRTVAFGSSVFVTAEFVDRELRCPQPGMNSRILAGVLAGEPVVHPEANLSDGKAGEALDLVVLSCNYPYQAMNAAEVSEAEMLLPRAFAETHAGYRLHRILLETVSERQYKIHESSGVWRTVRRFSACGHALIILTEKEAFSVSGSIAAPLFRYREPVLGLRDTEKQLLAEAMNGDPDNELAARMNLSLAAVKKRWATLFDRIAEVRPELLPHTERGDWRESRGPQKRHRILAYVREHPEEIRPYLGGRRRRAE